MQSMSLGPSNNLRRQLGAVFVVAAFFVAECGSASAAGPNLVVVTVSPDKTTAYCSDLQSGYYICVNGDPIPTEKIGIDDAAIVWLITTPGWVFDKNKGIDIQKVQGKKDWKSSYVVDALYVGYNKKGDGSTQYPYKIYVTKSDGTTPLKWDPTIMN